MRTFRQLGHHALSTDMDFSDTVFLGCYGPRMRDPLSFEPDTRKFIPGLWHGDNGDILPCLLLWTGQ